MSPLLETGPLKRKESTRHWCKATVECQKDRPETGDQVLLEPPVRIFVKEEGGEEGRKKPENGMKREFERET